MVSREYTTQQQTSKNNNSTSTNDRQASISSLISGLEIIPHDWRLTPLKSKKPYRKGWQTETPVSREEITKSIKSGDTGYGLRTGEGLLAIDVDGELAQAKLDEISNGDIPQTVSWTSGKPSRKQLLFRVPDGYLERLKPLTRWWFDTGTKENKQELDFRYNGFQSCLPPSYHPETGCYQWINSPADTDIAELPQWAIDLLVEALDRGEGIAPKKSKKTSNKGKNKGFGQTIKTVSSSNWIRHNSQNPCPVCGKTKTCRTNKDSGITHCRGRTGHPDFKQVGTDRHGFDMFKYIEARPISEHTETPKTDTASNKTLPTDKTQEVIVLENKDRDREIRKILDQLSLSDDHYQNLKARGLTDDQIKNAGYRSVNQWQKLSHKVDSRLAGVNKSGNGLVTPDRGILIPVPDEQGYLVGWQLRVDNPTDGKYIWSASEKTRDPRPTVKDANNELPLGIYGQASGDGVVYLCESTGIKPYIASLRLKAPVIGAAGNNFASSPNALERALTKLNAKKIVFLPDAGAVENKNIHNQTLKAVDLLTTELGFHKISIKFGWWGQWTKESKDIDEIEDVSNVEWLNCNDYLEKASKKIYEVECKRPYKELKRYTPDQEINVDYLSKDVIPFDKLETIIAIKSALGTNKTGSVGDSIKPDDGVVMIGNSNSLLIQSSERITQSVLEKDPNNDGLIHINSFTHQKIEEEMENGKDRATAKDLAEQEVRKLASKPDSKLSCCFDSLCKWFNPSDFVDKKIILDETTAGVKHLLTSTTEVSKKLRDTQDLFQYALQNASQVICTDGLMDDKTINYLSKLAPKKEVIKIENLKQKPVTFDYITGTKDEENLSKNDYSFILQTAKTRLPLFLISDSQKACEKIERELNEHGIIDGLRVDSKTVDGAEEREFLKIPNQWIEENEPEYLILSPTVKEGLDISVRDYFKLFVGLYFGVLDVDGLHQMTFRLRDPNVERMIFCKTSGQYNYENQSLNWQQNIQNQYELRLADLTSKYSNVAEISLSEKDHFIQEMIELNQQNVHDELFFKIQAVRGYETKNLRTALKDQLEDAGHILEERAVAVNEQQQIENKKRLKALGEQVKREETEQIWNRPALEDDESLEKLKERSDLESRQKYQREMVKKQLSNVENVVISGKPIWTQEFFHEILWNTNLNAHRRLWMLMNPEASRLMNEAKWMEYQKGETSKYQLRLDFSKVEILRKAGILDIIQSKEPLTKDSKVIQSFVQNCTSNEFYIAFGKKYWEGKTQILKFVQPFVEYFGCSLDYLDRTDGVRYYEISNPLNQIIDCNPDQYQRVIYELINLKQWEKLSLFIRDMNDTDLFYDAPQWLEQWETKIRDKINENRATLGLEQFATTPSIYNNNSQSWQQSDDEFLADAIAQAKKTSDNPGVQIRNLVTNSIIDSFTVEWVAKALGLAQDYVRRCVDAMADLFTNVDGSYTFDAF